jgi:hypothetical protein
MKKFLMMACLLSFSTTFAHEASITDDKGTSVKVEKDGSKFIRKADGTTIQVRADGSKLIKAADGTTIEVDVNGQKTVKKADGSVIESQ